MKAQNVLFVGETEITEKKGAHIILPPPKVAPLQEVFAEAILEHASWHHRDGTAKPKAKPSIPIILPPPKVEPLSDVFSEAMLENISPHRWHGVAKPKTKARVSITLPPPKVEPLHEVFAEAMLEDNSTHHRRSGLDWVVSLVVHVAILSVLLILPLYFTSGLDFQKYNLTFLAPPVTPGAPPPAPLTSSVAPQAVRNSTRRAYVVGKLTVPAFIPKVVIAPPGESIPPDEALMGAPGGVPGGIPGGQAGGVIGGMLGGILTSVPTPLSLPLPASLAEGPKKPVRVGGEVRPPRLLFGPEPTYPVLAKQSRVTGVVVIEAIIDEHGNVTGMRVISGHPLLIQSALTAVSKRKYEPTILDGEPIPIDMRVEISFRLS